MLPLLKNKCRMLMQAAEVKSLAHFYHEFECFWLRPQPRNCGRRGRCAGNRGTAATRAGMRLSRMMLGALLIGWEAEKNAAIVGLIRIQAPDDLLRRLLCSLSL